MSFPLDDYPSDRVVLSEERIVEESIVDPDLAEDVRASMEEWGEKSCLSVPISFNDEPVGMLVLIETERERRFSAKEIDLARGLGEQAAAAIYHARLYSRERSQNDRLLAAALFVAGAALVGDRRPIGLRFLLVSLPGLRIVFEFSLVVGNRRFESDAGQRLIGGVRRLLRQHRPDQDGADSDKFQSPRIASRTSYAPSLCLKIGGGRIAPVNPQKNRAPHAGPDSSQTLSLFAAIFCRPRPPLRLRRRPS